MKLTKQQKIETSQALAEKLKAAPHLFFTEFQGMKFVELDELRAQLRPLKCRYAVVKNSLVRYALKDAGVDGVDPAMLKGPVGLIVAENDDPVAPAKVIAALAKKFPQLKIRAGYVSRKWMTPGDCATLSKLPSKQELMGKIVGLLYTLVSQPVAIAQAPTRDMVLVVKALENKLQSESGAAAA
ncbi:MAG TPA: 50S ribosomal protein L10 [Elusimicrobia bacterium]|nr:MAG: 50S ribosomal protein L10 [Elusimicrobia bacterium GWC2_65_9]HAZ09272.1 50S ribosomal protein L10 [Elusimicrobiota bacterium]